ncbi:nitrite reductase small subunit NirD [Demequina capsici]|uniref:Nitrite reductase small subunit NirD n=1 Tax=Demequina capsici TaxID=3075620 RepID=A0AA96F7X0_9MICO|nr:MULTISPECIES: nitrite reductase small subunit NirD [unclassified Demequina]WNM25443.1 nitrite reductase small subunit NirD [Demequina sp. OYTSA14]WNM28324.1 nitrite reductase small subunit NirD [Demequina sp. PMTSA13]
MTTTIGTRRLVRVCALADLVPELGTAALVAGRQVAVFLLADGSVHAVQNLCPFSGAHVMSRGITGSRGEEPTIASPLYKQVFSLLTGECLATMDKEPVVGEQAGLEVYRVVVDNGDVMVESKDQE